MTTLMAWAAHGGSFGDGDYDDELESEIGVALAEPMTAVPKMYAVIMHNDDYTTMEFVVAVLMSEFYHTPDEAYVLMMQIHLEGAAQVAVLPKEVAQAKAAQVMALAESLEYPLLLTIEPQD